MAVLRILIYPDPRLRNVAQPVLQFDDEIRQHVQDMAQTMYEAPGVGLASIQVGIPHSIVVIDTSHEKDDLKVLINPEIIDRKGEQVIEEGCLSFPGYFTEIKRSEWIRFHAQDEYGTHYEMEADGLFAVCVQHEIDHLTGKLFTDYLSRLKNQRIRKQFEKAARLRRRESPVRV
ncbi:MAG: peptide deformylase [Acidiferrobacterales bacterium]|nr:peptide deformylase [Acidiferrobacterales bacterium]